MKQIPPSHYCATLERAVEIQGIGLHCGSVVNLRLEPSEEIGWVFTREDLPAAPAIPARASSIAQTTHATVLAHENATVSTVEHLLAALWTQNITHCRIVLDGPEVPILDGSALPWCKYLQRAGRRVLTQKRPIYALRHEVCVQRGDAYLWALPHNDLRLSARVQFETHWDSTQSVDLDVDADSFARELAPARTFTLPAWLEPLRAAGLIKGGSLDNALLLEDNGPSSPWRLENELARHKALDVLGDLALLFGENGGALHAHLIALKAGHELHRLWMQGCLNSGALQALEV